MLYEELHRLYGTHISQRLKRELTPSEFRQIRVGDLPDWLERRAEAAHTEYSSLLNNPLAASPPDTARTGQACRRWREAEDLAYLVAVAKDVVLNAGVG